jgi:hypothetical protein
LLPSKKLKKIGANKFIFRFYWSNIFNIEMLNGTFGLLGTDPAIDGSVNQSFGIHFGYVLSAIIDTHRCIHQMCIFPSSLQFFIHIHRLQQNCQEKKRVKIDGKTTNFAPNFLINIRSIQLHPN